LLAGKFVKCKVEVFSIGFGKELFRFKLGGTIYRFALFPLGGYNKLKDELSYSKSKYAFTNLSYRKKMLIILAGCFVNIFMGAITFLIGHKLGIYNLLYFGWLSFILGITNLIPFPALDGSYLIYYPLIIKKFGKKEGIKIIKFIVKLSLKIIIIINLLSLPIVIWIIYKGGL